MSATTDTTTTTGQANPANPAIQTHRPGPRSWALLTWTEAKLVARDTAGLIVPLGLPLLIMLMNGLGNTGEAIPALDGLTAFDAVVVPLTLVMIMAVIGTVNMPSFLAAYRKTGVLRRLAVTPANPVMVLIAQMLVSLFQTLIGVALALTVAAVAFDLSAPRNLAWAIAVGALTAAAMYAVGMLLAALAPTPNSAVAIGLVVFLGIMAVGGGFGPRENLPEWLATVGEILPYGAGMEALSASWMGRTPETLHLAALGGTTLVAGALAARLFRWT